MPSVAAISSTFSSSSGVKRAAPHLLTSCSTPVSVRAVSQIGAVSSWRVRRPVFTSQERSNDSVGLSLRNSAASYASAMFTSRLVCATKPATLPSPTGRRISRNVSVSRKRE